MWQAWAGGGVRFICSENLIKSRLWRIAYTVLFVLLLPFPRMIQRESKASLLYVDNFSFSQIYCSKRYMHTAWVWFYNSWLFQNMSYEF
jgi:hypothetical protein